MPRTSAGLLMYRLREGRVEVLLAHPGGPLWAGKDDGAWTIPEGEIDPGEDELSAARREFEEETGIRAVGRFERLAPVRQKGGKVVHAWAFESDCGPAARAAFDLVICTDVLQYLSHAQASAAIENLATLCRGALYFNLLTREDWEENFDRERTNGDVDLRSGDWYRRRLRPRFIPAGGGLFVRLPRICSRGRVTRYS